ncbi:MAG: thiamine phosphate synthase [Methanoregulaceae archaeon]
MKLDLYVVTDEGLSRGLTHAEIARRAVLGGADAVQLREKTKPAREILAAAREIRSITASYGRLFLVNDRLDIAISSGADGVHLGQDDLPLREARRRVPEDFIIGISVGSPEEAILAEEGGADYVALSPVFPTLSKPDAGPGSGLQTLWEIRARVSIPLIAIGGITTGNVQDVIRSGADGVAVISAVVSQDDIASAARNMKSLVSAAKKDRNL